MSSSKPFLIANIRTGLERDIEPWLLPNDAYPTIEDAYLFRGRIQRRSGFKKLGRLCENQPDVNLGARVAPPDNRGGVLPLGGALQINPGSIRITDGTTTFIDDNMGGFAVISGSGNVATATINYFTGVFANVIFTGAVPPGPPNVIVSYCVLFGRPVMGTRTYETIVLNQEQLIAFDTRKANIFSNFNNAFQDITFFLPPGGAAFSWTGGDSDFFWSINYLNAFWATNNIPGDYPNTTDTVGGTGDGIRWYDGTGWANFRPGIAGPAGAPTNFLLGGLIILAYRNRLVILNTVEGTVNPGTRFSQRARWSQNGTPYYAAPVPTGFPGTFDIDSWNSDIVGKGGFVDAPTSEQIVSAEFIKDTLIVYFERSTWQLRYTGNEVLPFIWEKINTELGAESTFSVVAFDRGVFAVGNYGITTCDSVNVQRIDQLIPDEVFNFHNGRDGPKRVHGIRDFTGQLVYWTFPNDDQNFKFPNKLLVYNYLDGSYSIFNDSFTTLGYFQPIDDIRWIDLPIAWALYNNAWNAGKEQSDYPWIVAGNQQGYVLQLNYQSVNDPSLYISAATNANPCVITSPDHNLLTGQIIVISGVNGMTQLNGNRYSISRIDENTFQLFELGALPTGLPLQPVNSTAFGVYTSGGEVATRNNILIVTKRFNPSVEGSLQVRMNYMDMFLLKATSSEFTVNLYIDEDDSNVINSKRISPISSQPIDKIWTRVYLDGIGQFIQLEFTFSVVQMFDPDLSDEYIEIHALMPWFTPAGRLTYGTIR